MQVSSIAAAPVRLAAVNVMGNLNPPTWAAGLTPMSLGSRAALNHIANSTRLNDVEKRSFARLLADIDQYAGGDPKLIIKVMALVALTESLHPEGKYPPMAQATLDRAYWERRLELAGQEASVVPQIMIPEMPEGMTATESGELNVLA